MQARELLVNQVTYLKYLLASHPDQVPVENLRPTFVSLQHLGDDELPHGTTATLHRMRHTLEFWLTQPGSLGVGAVQDVLKVLREALTVLGPANPPQYA